MDNVKDDRYYVEKIKEHIHCLMKHAKEVPEDELTENSMAMDAILFRITQISESADKISDSFKINHPEIPWRKIKGLRNHVVHDYGHVDFITIRKTVSEDIPDLKRLLDDV